MAVPLTPADFLDRAELVYSDRPGVIDEPQQPAPSLGTVTYGELAARARAIAAGIDEPGGAGGRTRRGRGRGGGGGRGRLGELGSAAGAHPRGHRRGPRLRAGQLPPA